MGAGERVVGVLGGMGPRATWSFCQRITELTEAKKDWEHLRVIVDCNTKIPSRTRAILYGETSPAEAMIASIHGLERAGADFVVVPCNSAHYWYGEIVKQIQIPWLNMLEVVAQTIKDNWGNRLVLMVGGYIPSALRIYDEVLDKVTYPNDKTQEAIIDLIEKRKLDMTVATRPFLNRLGGLYPRHLLLLACTELSDDRKYFSDLSSLCADTTAIYARATVEFAHGH